MNIQSEIDYFTELAPVDKARFICRLAFELAEETKSESADGAESSRLKFANEMNQRLARFCYQVLSEDATRPADEVLIRMLLGARAHKESERMVHAAYRRVVQSFESFDTTVLPSNH